MSLVTAICPACKKQIEVDSSEAVDFCKLCGKPVVINDAIKLYKDTIERNQTTSKPSKEIVDKFNAIVAQDYKAARIYLDDVVKKQYPSLYDYRLQYVTSMDGDIDGFGIYTDEANLIKLYTLNKSIADMYYKVLCACTNALIKKKCKQTFTGELPFLKLELGNIVNKLENIVKDVELANANRGDSRYGNAWQKLMDDIKHCKNISIKQGYDNKYINFTIKNILDFWSKKYVAPGSSVAQTCGTYIDFFVSRKDGKLLHNKDLFILLEEFLSPAAYKVWTKIDKEDK